MQLQYLLREFIRWRQNFDILSLGRSVRMHKLWLTVLLFLFRPIILLTLAIVEDSAFVGFGGWKVGTFGNYIVWSCWCEDVVLVELNHSLVVVLDQLFMLNVLNQLLQPFRQLGRFNLFSHIVTLKCWLPLINHLKNIIRPLNFPIVWIWWTFSTVLLFVLPVGLRDGVILLLLDDLGKTDKGRFNWIAYSLSARKPTWNDF